MSSSYTFHRSLFKGFFYLGRGGGHVLASYSNNMSWNAAEVYYFYGRALLELARVESTVLGNALNGGWS